MPSPDTLQKYDTIVLLQAGVAGQDTLNGTLFKKQIVKYGTWVNPSFPVEKMDLDEDFGQSLIDNFTSGLVGKIPVPLDHTDETDANTGEVMSLESIPGDGLYALLDIRDPNVVDDINNGLIFDVSIGFDWDYEDTKTGDLFGPTLLHVALVNNPYLKGMKPFEEVAQDIQNNLFASPRQKSAIMLSEAKARELNSMEKATVKNNQKYEVEITVKDEKGEEVKRTLKVGEEVEVPKDQSEAVLKQIESATDPAADEGDPKDPKEGDDDDSDDDDDDSDEDGDDDDGDEDLTPEQKQAKADKAELSALRKKNAKLELSAAYDKLLKAGKITPAQKKEFMSLSKLSSTTVQLSGKQTTVAQIVAGILNAGPKVVEFSESGSGKGHDKDKVDANGKPVKEGKLSESESKGLKALGHTDQDYEKTVEKHPELVAASISNHKDEEDK